MRQGKRFGTRREKDPMPSSKIRRVSSVAPMHTHQIIAGHVEILDASYSEHGRNRGIGKPRQPMAVASRRELANRWPKRIEARAYGDAMVGKDPVRGGDLRASPRPRLRRPIRTLRDPEADRDLGRRIHGLALNAEGGTRQHGTRNHRSYWNDSPHKVADPVASTITLVPSWLHPSNLLLEVPSGPSCAAAIAHGAYDVPFINTNRFVADRVD